MIIPICVKGEDKKHVLEYLRNVKNRNRDFPVKLWELKTKTIDLTDGRTLIFFYINVLIPVATICTLGAFLSAAGAMFVSRWFVLVSYGFLAMGFFVTDLWFYPVIKAGLKKHGVKTWRLYVTRGRALELLVKDGAK